MNKNLENILQHTECLSPEDIKNYLDDNLSADYKFKVESHLNECEFCNEAIEGFGTLDSGFVITGTNEINSKIDKKFKKGFSLQYLVAAASICAVLFFGAIFMLNNSRNDEQLSIHTEDVEEKLTEDKLAPVEAVNSNEVLEETEVEENTENSIPTIKDEEGIDVEVKDIYPDEDDLEGHAQYYGYNDEAELEISVEPAIAATEKEMNNTNENLNYEDLSMDNSISTNSIQNEIEETIALDETLKSTRSTTEISTEAAGSIPSYDKDDYSNNEIDFSTMMTLAQSNIYPQQEEVLEEVEVSSRKKKTTAYSANSTPIHANNNVIEIEKQYQQVKNQQYQTALNEINILINKDVWIHEESSTLKWLKSICELKLNLSAEQTLKELKRSKNPYQTDAKKLYNELY